MGYNERKKLIFCIVVYSERRALNFSKQTIIFLLLLQNKQQTAVLFRNRDGCS